MRYIGIITLLVLCLTLLLLTGCKINTGKPETVNGNLENQEDINQSSNDSQGSSTGSVEEPVIEDTEEPTEEPGTVYPQKWATGDGTTENPWANDCIQKAYDAVPVGGTIFLKAGYYALSAQVSISKQISIIGEGMGKTIIKTADATGFSIDTDYFTIESLTVDGDAQTDGTQYLSCIRIGTYSDYALFRDIELKSAGYYGINVYEVNNSLFQKIYAHDNYTHGLHPGSNTAGRNRYNTYRDIYAWDNRQLGFADRGNISGIEQTNNVYDNLQCWDNGEYGIEIAYQSGGVLFNSFASGNGKIGIQINNIGDFNVHDCSTTLNDEEGLHIINSDNINFTNVIIKNSNVSDKDNIGGIKIQNSSDIKFTSCQSYDDRDTPLQAYGIELTGANTNISLVNCKLTPNKKGEIYNPAGVVLK